MKRDSYTRTLNLAIKDAKASFKYYHKHSLTSEDSDSYDEAQRLNGFHKALCKALEIYLEIKRRDALKS